MVLYNGNAEVIGNFRALNFYKASDINIKEDIRLLFEDVTPRDVLMQIDGVAYKFKQGIASSVNKRFVGFIAQQVESAVPEAVQLIDGILHVDYESRLPFMNESIRANFSDLKDIKTENEVLKQILDQIYNEFVTRDDRRRQQHEQKQRDNADRSNRSRIHPAWKGLIALLALAVVLIVSIQVISYMRRVKGPPDSHQPPAIPLPPDDPTTEEYRILKEFYDATDGPNWLINTHWLNKSVSECHWHGIQCEEPHFRLVTLDLTNNSLKGTIPSSFSKLNWWQINLSYNQLNGTIPSGLLRKIERFNVMNNRLTGPIPSTVSSNPGMVFIAAHNRLTGTIPNFLPVEFDVSNNLLEGVLPPFDEIPTRNRTMITSTFNVAHNNLSGDVGSLSNLTHIIKLNISHNPNLTGNLTLWSVQLRSLVLLDVSYTAISRIIENVAVPGQPTLRSCDLSNVPFKCPLPDWAFKCNAKCA